MKTFGMLFQDELLKMKRKKKKKFKDRRKRVQTKKRRKKAERLYKPKTNVTKSPKTKSKSKRKEKVEKVRKEKEKSKKKGNNEEKKKEEVKEVKEVEEVEEVEGVEGQSKESDSDKSEVEEVEHVKKDKGKDELTDEEEDSESEPDRKKLIREKSLVAGVDLPRIERVEGQKDKKQMQIAFNTTDLPEVRQSLVEIVKSLLQNPVCEISVGLISNSGVKGDNNPNLHNLPFSKNFDEISKIITDSFGEGKNWEQYYRLVLEKASTFKWTPKLANNQSFLILVGSNDSVDALTTYLHQHNDFNNLIGRLNMSGVGVFAFNHEQLDLLAEVVSNLS